MLFIFESIGTSELILVGIVALVFLGPRKLPQMARKIGKIIAEFRGTANEFKETWQREASFEEEKGAFDLTALEAEADSTPRTKSSTEPEPVALPTIKEVDPASFAALEQPETTETTEEKSVEPNAKENWL